MCDGHTIALYSTGKCDGVTMYHLSVGICAMDIQKKILAKDRALNIECTKGVS